jgi:hydrogenase/urease accessory protein HupE
MPAEIEAGLPALQAYFARRLFVNSGGSLCQPTITDIDAREGVPRALIALEYRCPAPIETLRIEMHLFDGVSPNWVSLARLTWGKDVREFAFREGAGSWEVSGAPSTGLLAQARSFLALGVEHIFTGYDHLLFLVGLLLLGGRFWSLFKIVTAFTVAHSVTLILAALEVVNVPPRIVEPAIALSIAYVGAENFFLKSTDRRWIIAFAFGLIHGFGFAGILREMGLPQRGLVLSLLSFNVGVEAGQLAVVAVVLPVILLIRRQAWQRRAVYAASLAITGMGLYWFVERLWGG